MPVAFKAGTGSDSIDNPLIQKRESQRLRHYYSRRGRRLTVSTWSGWLGGPEMVPGLPPLDYPLPGAERTAVLGARLRPERGVRSYPYWRTPELEAWRPDALAGHRSELVAIGELRRRRFIPLKDLRFPLLVFSALREGPLCSEEHDRLWDLYGLPVYEQIRSVTEELLGWECPARDGWHLALNANGEPELSLARVRAAGWRGRLIRGRCACGETCLRLMAESQAERLSLACGAD
jgi:hypothetical protein